MIVTWSQQLQPLGALRDRTVALEAAVSTSASGRTRSIAASRSIAGVSQGLDQKRGSVQERCRSVAGAGSEALQRPGVIQERCRGRSRSVAPSGSVTGALQGQDQVRCCVQERHRSVRGAAQERHCEGFVTLQGPLHGPVTRSKTLQGLWHDLYLGIDADVGR